MLWNYKLKTKSQEEIFAEAVELLKKAVAQDATLSAPITAVCDSLENLVTGQRLLIEKLSNTVKEQNLHIEKQSKIIKEQNLLIEKQSKIIKEQNLLIEKLSNEVIELKAKLANKTITVRKVSNEGINGKGSEQADASAKDKPKNNKPKTTPPKADDLTVTKERICIGYGGEKMSYEEALKKVGTIFTGTDGKRYKYLRINDSSEKFELEIGLKIINYSKLQIVAVDENDNPLDEKVPATKCPETDFLKRSSISISLMSYILEQRFCLKSPLNRTSQYLAKYGIKLTRQQLYNHTDHTAMLLKPLYDHLATYIGEANLIGVDETYWSCREKRKIQGDSPDDDPGKKSQRSKSKSLRSYVIGIISPKVCYYFHSLQRDSEQAKNILLDNGIQSDCFVESDAFYKKAFSIKKNVNGREERVFLHGICWVHARRNFCELINYGTHKDGSLVKEIVDNKWEQDIKDAIRIKANITRCFNIHNTIIEQCMNDSSLDVCELKREKLKPYIDEILDDAKAIFKLIERRRANCADASKPEPLRKCSDRLYKAIVYLVNNEERLRAFLDSPYGVMQNNNVEEKFRELDILRNGMIANDTCRGADNLTEFYSFYKTCQIHNVDFRTYMKKAITKMMEHIDEIDFEKDSKNTITGYNGHHIPAEVLDQLMPWALV